MKYVVRVSAILGLAGALLISGCTIARAGTTGTISGIVTSAQNNTPIAGVKVTAASLSQTESTTTDARGFFSLVSLAADTYTVSFQVSGYSPVSVPGVTVFQDQNVPLNQKLETALKTIANVQSYGGSNLVKANQGSDVYTVSGAQLDGSDESR